MRYYITALLSLLVFLPVSLQAQQLKYKDGKLSSKGYLSLGSINYNNPLMNINSMNASLSKKMDDLLKSKFEEKTISEQERKLTPQQEMNIKKMNDFLKHYDEKIAQAYKNTSYQAKIASYKNLRPAKVYLGRNFNSRAITFYKKIKALMENLNDRAQRLKIPTSYNNPVYPERYRSIESDERMCVKMIFEYYTYITSCTSGKVDADIGQYMFSERMEVLLNIANESLVVEDMPTFYWAIDEISVVYLQYKEKKTVLKHIFANGKSLGI